MCCTQYASKFGKLSSGHRTGKGVFIPVPKKGNAKECSDYCTIAFISHASKVMLKILQARLQQYMNRELSGVQDGFRKTEEPEIKLPTSAGSLKKQESSRQSSTSALLIMPKPLTMWITINCGKFWKRWEYQTTWPVSWETCVPVRKQQLELDMEQQTGSKQEKEYAKAVYCHSTYLTYYRVHHEKPWAGWSTSCNQDCREKYQ